ncbi:hypothetical protein MATL_G00191530 [Megalops atlanticus]|uniref:Helicase-associated domain-containing protein n=1 Tax=Megalops atlanticus TaxID=7932 RepID=A0A9D3PLP5_MEGAT|nr:hypothetical protein MATL_G00191530 [Megalops atlanticus]
MPHWCAEFCLSVQYQHGGVVCTQTDRRCAVDLALRVADEMDVNIGHEVGYSVPLANCCSSDTVLRYCTDDLLLREMMSDPLLERYGVVVIDQAHERTVSTDVLLGLLKEIQLQRPELQVVILTVPHMSDLLASHYGNAPLIQLGGASVPEVVYSKGTQEDCFRSALRLVLEIHHAQEEGDIVLFLASAQEITCACEILRREAAELTPSLGELVPVALYPGQGGGCWVGEEEQAKSRKVFLTSSHSEAPFWGVDTVNFVIDTGVQKRHVYKPRIRANSIVTRPISKSQAESRRQLVGSTGKCFCLYPEETQLPAETPASILEANITPTVLFLKRMDIAGLGPCDFISRPDPEGLMQALEELDYLAALDDDGNLSEIGIIMSEFPLEPQMAKTLLASCEFDCVNEVVTIAAMLTAPSCFLEPSPESRPEVLQRHGTFRHPEGDHFTLINVYRAFKQNQQDSCSSLERWCQEHSLSYPALQMADAIRSELTDILRRLELPVSEPAFGTKSNTLNIQRALLAGFFMQFARRVDAAGQYFVLTHKHMAEIHPNSSYLTQAQDESLPEWVLFHEYTLAENSCIHVVSEVSPELFIQMAPQYFFYNLPASESKDILQTLLDHEGSVPCKVKRGRSQTLGSESQEDCAGNQAQERCVLQ